MRRFYLDTSILLDFIENRSDGLRPLGEFAFSFFQKVMKNGDIIIISDLTIVEFEKYHIRKEMEEIFDFLHIDAIIISFSKEDSFYAKQLSIERNIHESDALHVVLAIKYDAIIITRDNHFDLVSDKVIVLKPEFV